MSLRKSGKYKDEDYQKELEAQRKDDGPTKKPKLSGARQSNLQYAFQNSLAQFAPQTQQFPLQVPGQWQFPAWQGNFLSQPQLLTVPEVFPLQIQQQQLQQLQKTTNQAVKCYNCQGYGHIAKNCLNKPAAQGAASK